MHLPSFFIMFVLGIFVAPGVLVPVVGASASGSASFRVHGELPQHKLRRADLSASFLAFASTVTVPRAIPTGVTTTTVLHATIHPTGVLGTRRRRLLAQQPDVGLSRRTFAPGRARDAPINNLASGHRRARVLGRTCVVASSDRSATCKQLTGKIAVNNVATGDFVGYLFFDPHNGPVHNSAPAMVVASNTASLVSISACPDVPFAMDISNVMSDDTRTHRVSLSISALQIGTPGHFAYMLGTMNGAL
ncbi:hypothetical protein C8Q77DRAFT_463830 [Trametes polyzona]|nr:hypothetical protein C8Q77DRAFT_463830 [Trametes polyzona]